MAVNRDLILAAIAGNAGSASMAYFAPKGTTLPTAATGSGSALDAAFLDGGYIHSDGLVKAVAENSTDVTAYGTNVPVRTIVTQSKATFNLKFLETNKVSQAVYHRLALGSISVAAGGKFTITEGAARTQEYAAVFDVSDGSNYIRGVVPALQVTDRTETALKPGEPVSWGVTLTAYPGSDGVAITWYMVVANLT